ncbi:MAG: MSHA pilin protein MshA [Shewanella psychromarinicola]|jgi:MSHA pilin protein MshA
MPVQHDALTSARQTNSDDLIDIDIDNEGVFETRLRPGDVDNTDIERWIVAENNFTLQDQ